MDFIGELLVQLILEIAGEFLGGLVGEAGASGVRSVLRSAISRGVVSVVVGLGAGLWWGARLASLGHTTEPRTLWVSLALALLGGAAGVLRRTHPISDAPSRNWVSRIWPWFWPPDQWVSFTLLNLALAVGIAIGFQVVTP